MSEWRADPVTGRWMVVGTNRPVERADFDLGEAAGVPALCPLCEGHEDETAREILAVRDGSLPNAPGWRLRVVPNGVPALETERSFVPRRDDAFVRADGLGAHEIIVESPSHAVTWLTMDDADLLRVLVAWRDRIVDLRRDERLRAVCVVKNHGARAGDRLGHAHSQLLALPVVPPRLEEAVAGARRYHDTTGRCVYCDVLASDLADGARVVLESKDVVAVTPFASRTPFAVTVLPRVHAAHYADASLAVLQDLAGVLHTLVRRVDRSLEGPAWSVALQTAPAGHAADAAFHWHLELVPHVFRLTGFDLASGTSINPVPPEEAARVLRRPQHPAQTPP